MDDLLNQMGKRLVARRKQLRLTQEEIAERTDLTTQTISTAETGKKALRLFVKRNFSRDGKNQAGKAPWTVKSRFRGRVV